MSKTAAPQLDKIIKETAEFKTQYSDACTKSGEIFLKGVEDMMGTMMTLAKTSAEKQAGFVKEAMAIKTINEFAEVQNKIAKANFDDFIAGATQVSEIGAKILTESSEPVSAQIKKTVEKTTKAMAA